MGVVVLLSSSVSDPFVFSSLNLFSNLERKPSVYSFSLSKKLNKRCIKSCFRQAEDVLSILVN